MIWCARRENLVGGRLTLMIFCLYFHGAWAGAADNSETDRWFDRHSDEGWRRLAERWLPVKESMTSPVENLLLPLDHFPNGRIKAQLAAKRAQIFVDGIIFAEDLTVELFNETGQSNGRLTAEGCIFDRSTKHGYCEGLVSMEKEGDRLKGRGMYFSFDEQFIKILGECEIRTRRIRNNFGRLR